MSGSSPSNYTTPIIAGAVFEQNDLDIMLLLAEKQAILRQHSRKHLKFLVTQEPSTGTWSSNPKHNKTSIQGWRELGNSEGAHWKAWSSQTHCVHSTHPGGKLLPLYSQEGLCLYLTSTGVKGILDKGSQFCTCSVSKAIFLGSELWKIMLFQNLMAYLLKSFSKKEACYLGVHWLNNNTCNHCNIHWVLKMKQALSTEIWFHWNSRRALGRDPTITTT